MNKAKIILPGSDNYFMRESYNVLRTNLQFCGQDVKIIAITSCEENEGKTIISLNIGKSFSELDKKVLVVDADLRKSVIMGRNTDVQNAKGLSEVITGLESFENAIYKTQYENMDIVFSGKYPPNPVELLNGVYFSEFLEKAKQIYDYVIIDTPPLGRVIDAAVITAVCDSSILVIGSDKIKASKAQETVEQLKKSGSNVLGVVMNNAKKRHKFKYGKNKYYYNKYY